MKGCAAASIRKTGEIDVFAVKKVVKRSPIPDVNSLDEAREVKPDAQLEEELEFKPTVGLGRISAQMANR
jgi:hypothetical protein